MKATNLVEFGFVFQNEARAALSKDWSTGQADQVKDLMAPVVLSSVIEEIMKAARQMEYLNLKSCNIGSNDADDARWDKLKAKIIQLCEHYKIKPVFQGDPRGAAVGIICEHTQRYNSWGGHESGFRLNFEGK